jgi:hypothetical protein
MGYGDDNTEPATVLKNIDYFWIGIEDSIVSKWPIIIMRGIPIDEKILKSFSYIASRDAYLMKGE